MFSWFKRTPNAQAVMSRLLLLKAVFLKGSAAAPLDTIASHLPAHEKTEIFAQVDRMFDDYPKSLRSSGLWKQASEEEKEFFSAKACDLTSQQLRDASWTVEAMGCLSWALQLMPQIPPYDCECDPRVPTELPDDSVTDLVKGAALRPKKELLSARELAELWHWRARTRQIQEENIPFDLPEGLTLDKIIEMAATKAAEDGLLPSPIDSDFPAFGKAYRDLSPDEYQTVFSITRERHRAFNWLCGYSPSGKWEDTPTDT